MSPFIPSRQPPLAAPGPATPPLTPTAAPAFSSAGTPCSFTATAYPRPHPSKKLIRNPPAMTLELQPATPQPEPAPQRPPRASPPDGHRTLSRRSPSPPSPAAPSQPIPPLRARFPPSQMTAPQARGAVIPTHGYTPSAAFRGAGRTFRREVGNAPAQPQTPAVHAGRRRTHRALACQVARWSSKPVLSTGLAPPDGLGLGPACEEVVEIEPLRLESQIIQMPAVMALRGVTRGWRGDLVVLSVVRVRFLRYSHHRLACH